MTKISRSDRYAEVHAPDSGVESLTVLPVALHGNSIDRFIIGHRLAVSKRVVGSEMELTREQVEWLRDRLTDVLMESDPAYAAHAERESAKAAELASATPATDAEYMEYLKERTYP